MAGAAVYWTTGNYYYAGGATAIFPALGTVLSVLGITKSAGFRSAAIKIADLKNELASLNPVSQHDMNDVEKLCRTHNCVAKYQDKVKNLGRSAVNGELAMYWEFDTSTMAKTAKGRDYLEKAKESVKG